MGGQEKMHFVTSNLCSYHTGKNEMVFYLSHPLRRCGRLHPCFLSYHFSSSRSWHLKEKALGEVSSAPRRRPLRSVWMESAGALSFVGLHRLPQNFINRLPNRGRGRIAIILLVTNRERFYLNCLGFFS